MIDFDRIREVKRAARDRLFAIPGVHCIAIGAKKVAGQPTDVPSIQVFVTTKRPIDELDPAEVIPAEIDGVKIDVIQSPIPTLHSEDEDEYDVLRGGIQIQARGDNRGFGTLGFFVQSSDGQKIYGVTNHHVLLRTFTVTAGLDRTVTPDKHFAPSVKIEFVRHGFGAIDTHTIVAVKLTALISQPKASLRDFEVVLSTPEGFHESDVASRISQEINALGVFNAIPTGPSVTITPVAPVPRVKIECQTFGTKLTDNSDLSAKITNNTIRFSGQASDPGGAFVNINVGGELPSFGVFVPFDSGDDGTRVASNTVASINALISARGLQNVSAKPLGTDQVTIDGVDEIDCEMAKDDRVGQPTNCMCTRDHKCCSKRIGRIAAAALHVDAALIRLDGEKKYIPKVEDIPENGGAIHATHDITAQEAMAGFPVQKRGRSTRLTKGTARSFDAEGVIGGTGLIGFKSDTFPNPSFFHRYYRNAIRIETTSGHFSEGGDSGSAVMDSNNNLVGLLFGGAENADDGHGVMMRIGDVLDAFKDLNVSVSTTTDPNTPLTVPGPSFAAKPHQLQHAQSPITAGTPVFFAALDKAEADIESIPAGKELSDAVRRHIGEGYRLVTTNRRVGAVWKRNGGQQIFPALLHAAQNPARRPADKIGGRPLAECLNNIRHIFERYGSAAFVADLKRHGDQIIQLLGLSYNEAKDALESAEAG